jgi:hypothetical protein
MGLSSLILFIGLLSCIDCTHQQNTCPVSTPDCPSGVSTLIAGETDAPTYGKVLLSIEVALAVFP